MAATLFETIHLYDTFSKNGVISLIVAAMLSLVSVLLVLVFFLPGTKTYKRTHILGYFVCLLVSNVIQSTGTVMNIKWTVEGGVFDGPFCRAQGGIKQAGNIGNACWTLALALHLFNLLFLRVKTSRSFFLGTIAVAWGLILTFVLIGPFAIQNLQKGPYFGVSGNWCWITDEYNSAQFFLEYFFEYVSAGGSFILYTIILLRVRGNLAVVQGKHVLRFVPRSERWQLSLGRDFIDSTMLGVAQRVIWFPVAYSVLIVPIGAARLSEFAGQKVPAGVTFFTDFVFNLTGLVNVILLLTTHRMFPDTALPDFNARRKELSRSVFVHGITPFRFSVRPEPTQKPPSIESVSADSVLVTDLDEKPLPPSPKSAHISRVV